MEIFWIVLLLFVINGNTDGNNDMPAVYILRSPRNNCWNPQMEIKDLPNDRFSASSFYQNKSNFQAHQARLINIFRSNPHSENGNAWCPSKRVGTSLIEWIEVNFQSVKIINGIYTMGRGEGNFIEFVPRIQITYQRQKRGKTFGYRNLDNNSIIPINTDARTQSRTSFIPPIIASSIRIFPYDPHNANVVCIKFAMFGCNFDDSPLSYSLFDGDVFDNHNSIGISTTDRYYDGDKINQEDKVFLQNGLGILNDNKAWLGHLDGLRDPYFMGWFIAQDSSNQNIPLSFHYDKNRNFTKVRIFSYMLPNRTVDLFTKVILRFQTDSLFESEVKIDVSSSQIQINRFGGLIFTSKLANNVGQLVDIQLYGSLNKWILISEINFESTPVFELPPHMLNKKTTAGSVLKTDHTSSRPLFPPNKHFVSRKNNQNSYPNISGRDIFLDSEKDTTFAVATIIGLILLVIFISIIGIVLYKMKQKRQYKKNSKMQYMIANEIGSVYQQYSQTNEKLKNFLSPTFQQAHSLTSDNGSIDSPQGRLLETSVYSSLPHKINKDPKTIRDDETYLLKEYSKNAIISQSSVVNVSPFSNKESSLKKTPFNSFSWNANGLAHKTGQEYASATIYPLSYPEIQYKRSSGSSVLLHNDYKQIPNQSPYHIVPSSPLFSNSPLGMSQLPSTIQIIANPYFNHVDKAPSTISNELSTPLPSHKSLNFVNNDSRNASPYSISTNSFLCWTSPEANYFSNFDFSKLIQIQSVCGHISFGAADFESLNETQPSIFNEPQLPILPLSSITTTELICQGQYGQIHQAFINDNFIRSMNSMGFCDNGFNRKLSTDAKPVLLTLLSENSTSDIRSQFQEEIRIRLMVSDPHVIAVLAMVSDSLDDESKYLNHHFGYITETFINLHQYIRTQAIADHSEVPKSIPDFTYTSQNPCSLNYSSLIYIGSQIASGMKHMEEQGILHRDLACRNCMVGSNMQVKISNGGKQISSPFEADYLSIPLSDYSTINLPIRWMAPESLFIAKFSTKSDVWAFGVTLWEVLTHCHQQPYFYWSNSQVMENLYNVLLAQNSQFHYLTRPKNCPKEIYDMIRECWHPIEDYRPNFHEIQMFLQRKCNGFYSADAGFSKLSVI